MSTQQRHILSVLVENKPGVLSRVTGLVSRRGFNIESVSYTHLTISLQRAMPTRVHLL